ncbi:hypothetical protein HYDPIDRAFT_135185 [Hydnomerulius pinastri MD-312]|uniref:Uncharacterized protein n=1 Tax=Hydnomerulius pinastri MD-312 TaxID=994086 RepID=A0A0C9WD74_9AGAM|nr:hypothetical protein HYDPIDRAFT_135185 [Hydnomerulius pinastri MD-312]
MNPLERPAVPANMLNPTTDISNLSEPESLSDSDWLDIASTGGGSDDNDSICSFRETDQERLSPRSRSRQSSLSYSSSRDGDVDAWEGLIEDSADEGMPDDVLAPSSSTVPLVSDDPGSSSINHTEETSFEEQRVKEGLDQSMISTLSSSRSSSLHASTAHSSSRDLRLSFPDPITSSREELLNTSYEDVQSPFDAAFSVTDPDVTLDLQGDEDEEMLSASQILPEEPQQPQATSIPHPIGPELKVFLYGFPSQFNWSLIDTLLQKVVSGAGLTSATTLGSLGGPVRHLVVAGHSERDRSFPHVITVVDKTRQQADIGADPTATFSGGLRSLAVVYMPSCPPRLPEHTLYLPAMASPAYSVDLPEFRDVARISAQETWDMFNVPDHQLLRITASGEPAVVDMRAIDELDPARVHRAFSRVWSDKKSLGRGAINGSHALTIIAVLSLVLGVVVRSAISTSTQPIAATVVATTSNCSSTSIWQLLRPVANREHEAPAATPDNSLIMVPSAFKDFALSVFSAESTSVSLPRANPTGFRRASPSTLSERLKLSKDLILRPSPSVLAPDNRPKALSIITDTSPTIPYHPGPASTGHALSALVHTSIPNIVKEYAPVITAIVNQDVQDILDALDALVQAISRQAQTILTQTTTFIHQSAAHLENSVQSFETVKETFYTHNERAQRRAREMKEQGAKWLYSAGEVLAGHAQSSKAKAKEIGEQLAIRAERARGKAKEMAEEIQEFLHDPEGLEGLGSRAWDLGEKEWRRLHKRAGESGNLKSVKTRKGPKRQFKPTIFL